MLTILVFAGCDSKTSTQRDSGDLSSIYPSNVTKVENALPRQILLLIGRGGCCNGHIIYIGLDGTLDYSVGVYHMANPNLASARVPEIAVFDTSQITRNEHYAPKKVKLSDSALRRLSETIRKTETISFMDSRVVKDAYQFNLYIDERLVASGYRSIDQAPPEKLQELLTLIIDQVGLYDLPGMA